MSNRKTLSLPKKQTSIFSFVSSEKGSNNSSPSSSTSGNNENKRNSWKLDLNAFMDNKESSSRWSRSKLEDMEPSTSTPVLKKDLSGSKNKNVFSECNNLKHYSNINMEAFSSHSEENYIEDVFSMNHNDVIEDDWRNYSIESNTSSEQSPSKCPQKETNCTKSKTSTTPSHNTSGEVAKDNASCSPSKKKSKLKAMKLDKSLGEWIERISSSEYVTSAKEDAESIEKSLKFCKVSYLEILEKTVYAFDCIPLSILDKFPGFDSVSYTKLKMLRQKLKASIKLNNSSYNKLKHNSSSKVNKSQGENHNASIIEITSDESPIKVRNISKPIIKSNVEDSDEEFSDFITNKTLPPARRSNHLSMNNTYNETESQIVNKQSDNHTMPDDHMTPPHMSAGRYDSYRQEEHSKIPDSKSSTETSNDNPPKKQKGKFVFKRPSKLSSLQNSSLSLDSPSGSSAGDIPSSTLERVKMASSHLKPMQELKDPPKQSKPNDSSAMFQPANIDPIMLAVRPCAKVTPITTHSNTSTALDASDYMLEGDDEDLSHLLREELECDVSFSMEDTTTRTNANNTSANANASTNQRELNSAIADTISSSQLQVDEDGWPEYRIEDFEDEPWKETSVAKQKSPIRDNIPSTSNNNSNIGMGNFHSSVRNDGITGEFDGMNYPHSSELMEQFKEKFGLKSFRPNQLQVINATLTGNDCFVLMPTGGGKSLCYQLPAILTPGVTIVISPLKSLILDQVFKLNSLDIPSAHLSGDMTLGRLDDIYHQLSLKEPTIKLLYVTPEKISASQKFQNILDSLYARDKLARFVIDEAHCVSQWGHDFRPDYKRLSILRNRFPRVPLMALTATANPRVRIDILHQLSIPRCKWFLCSFNRPNLKYLVMPKKGSTVIKDIEDLIKTKFPRDSGIVYCLSRKECDSVAALLMRAGISAGSYHAGLSDKQRETVQNSWLDDRYKVVCATIAFGMGIDKSDVRFVIHHSLPKSVEGYYQEAGRAGRDGDQATCIVFYSYTDVMRYRKLLDLDASGNYEAKKIHIANLMRMVEFCENVTECRRAQVLAYFAETFTREQCKAVPATACDNCLREDNYKVVDVTEDCKVICRCVRDLCSERNRFTLLHVAEVFKGSSIKKIVDNKHNLHPAHGRGRHWPKGDVQRLMHQLITKEFLMEELIVSNSIANAFLRLGPQVHKLMNGEVKVLFPMKSEKKTLNMTAGGAAKPVGVDSPLNIQLKKIQDKCYSALLETCRNIAHEKNITISSVMNLNALKAMAENLPETPQEMLCLPHVTKANFEKFGKELLDITLRFSAEKLFLLSELEEEKKREEESRSQVSYDSDMDWEGAARDAVRTTQRSTTKRKGGRGAYRGRAKRFKRGRSNSARYSPKKSQAKTRGRGGGAGGKRGKKRGGASTSAGNNNRGGAGPSYLGFMPMPTFGRD